MSLNVIDGDCQVKGQLVPQSIAYPASGISDAHIAALAAISASKQQHEHRKSYSQDGSVNNAAAGPVPVHTARFAGSVVAVLVSLVVPPDTASGGGGRTAIIDVKKNGVSILSAPITLNSTNTAYTAVAATIATAAYAAGEVFTVTDAAGVGTTGTYPKGVNVEIAFNEAGA